MKTTLTIIDAAMKDHPAACLAFSGGSDSVLLLDIIFRHTAHRPLIIFADSQMEYPETLPFIQKVCDEYGAVLHVARATRTPLEQWKKSGYPMQGKLAARVWSQKHRGRDFGYKIDVSSCCRNMKIQPARKLARSLGCTIQFTGQRGGSDDMLRQLRTLKDGAIHFVQQDKLWIANPLTGWTDCMGRRYREKHNLPQHPAKAKGAVTIGCVCCGGGSQFSISAYRLLRKTWPEGWWKFVVDAGLGPIILSIKYDAPLDTVKAALDQLGGIEAAAKERPHLFDFSRKEPLPGYSK